MLVLTFLEISDDADFLDSVDVPGKDICGTDRSDRSDEEPALVHPAESAAGAAAIQ